MFRISNYSISPPLLLYYCYSSPLIVITISRVIFDFPAVFSRKQRKMTKASLIYR
jgi:hypothetical protein